MRHQQFYRDDEVYYQRAIAVDPRNATVMGYLGDVDLERREDDQAMAWFKRAVQTAPEDTNAKYHLARGLMRTKQFAAAVPYLKDLAYGHDQSTSKTRRSVLLLSLANAEIELNEPDKAESTLDDLSTLDFAFPGLHRTRGILFQREGRLQQAQDEYSLEYRLSGDRESGRQAAALAKSFSRNQ
jgi:predicted Zn-dependent protease